MQLQEIPGSTSAIPATLLPNKQPHIRVMRTLLVVWRAMTSSRKVAVGSSIVGFFIVVGLFGPLFIPGDPNA
ncbi:MAG TPA: hypothetical protein VKU38_19290, partial [Ktedonobacteraceae bacterium]|nr:hypothetical protein [Ktedonobacteraceae bacterium]